VFNCSVWVGGSLERLFRRHNDSFDHDTAAIMAAFWGFTLIFWLWKGFSTLPKASPDANTMRAFGIPRKNLWIAVLFLVLAIDGFSVPFSIFLSKRHSGGIYWALPVTLTGLAILGFFLSNKEMKRPDSAIPQRGGAATKGNFHF